MCSRVPLAAVSFSSLLVVRRSHDSTARDALVAEMMATQDAEEHGAAPMETEPPRADACSALGTVIIEVKVPKLAPGAVLASQALPNHVGWKSHCIGRYQQFFWRFRAGQ